MDPIETRRQRSPLARHGQDSCRAWDRLKLGRYREMNQEFDRNEHCRHKNPGQRSLAAWQTARVRAFVDENLRRKIHAAARRSKAHFSRSFKNAFGETPRLRGEETAGEGVSSDDDHLGNAERNSSECVGFSDQHIFACASGRRLVKVHPDGDETLSADKDYPIGTEQVHQGTLVCCGSKAEELTASTTGLLHPWELTVQQMLRLGGSGPTDGVIGRPSLWIAEDFGCCASG